MMADNLFVDLNVIGASIIQFIKNNSKGNSLGYLTRYESV